jgi:hypothetical protein
VSNSPFVSTKTVSLGPAGVWPRDPPAVPLDEEGNDEVALLRISLELLPTPMVWGFSPFSFPFFSSFLLFLLFLFFFLFSVFILPHFAPCIKK